MSWKEKAVVINSSLGGELHLVLDLDNNWYASAYDVNIGGNGFLDSVGGRGETVEKAVEEFWKNLTEIPEELFITVHSQANRRQQFRWNGSIFERIVA